MKKTFGMLDFWESEYLNQQLNQPFQSVILVMCFLFFNAQLTRVSINKASLLILDFALQLIAVGTECRVYKNKHTRI